VAHCPRLTPIRRVQPVVEPDSLEGSLELSKVARLGVLKLRQHRPAQDGLKHRLPAPRPAVANSSCRCSLGPRAAGASTEPTLTGDPNPSLCFGQLFHRVVTREICRFPARGVEVQRHFFSPPSRRLLTDLACRSEKIVDSSTIFRFSPASCSQDMGARLQRP